MDTFKKIYTAIMGLTVISTVVLCLGYLGIFDYTSNESFLRIFILALVIMSVSLLFSRSANVIANRKNTGFAYIAVFIGLAFVLLAALEIIFSFSVSVKSIYMVICLLIAVLLPVLVLEVPPANSSHTKFQIITVFLVLVAFTWNAYNLYQTVDSLFIDTEVIIEETDSDEEIEEESSPNTIKTVITFGAVLCFLLNPMIRVHYMEIDYELTKEIDNIIKEGMDKKNIPKKNVLPKKEENKVEEPVPMIQGENSSFTNNVPVEFNIPVDEPIKEVVETQGMTADGKVINLNFKQDDIVEAVIPTIDGLENNDNITPNENKEIETPVVDNNVDNNQTPTNNNETKEPNQQ